MDSSSSWKLGNPLVRKVSIDYQLPGFEMEFTEISLFSLIPHKLKES